MRSSRSRSGAIDGIRLVDHPDSFRDLMAELVDAPLVAMDTEAASFHRYLDRIYLIQLSTRRRPR